MQTLFNSKNYYTKDILSGVVDESKLTFLRSNLQRYMYIYGSFNAYRTRPSNAAKTIHTIRESKKDDRMMSDLTGIFCDTKGVHIASGYFEYGGESKSIAWLLSNNHTSQLPALSWSPKHDMYFLTDPFSALKLVQITSTQARKLTTSEDDLRKLMKDFSSTKSSFINTLYNEDDLKILATKADVELDFSRHQFNVDGWINEYCFPQPKNTATVNKTSNIDKLISLGFHL